MSVSPNRCRPLGALLATLTLFATARSAPAAVTDSAAPHLARPHGATQLIVDGKPFLCLAGELRNSTASGLENMNAVWPRLERMHLNTVVLPISWELLEPDEGQFDFTLVDGLLAQARDHQMKLVLLWFGSWKNGLSSYQPLWVKKDPKRFPLARDAGGAQLDILSTFGDATAKADGTALAALLAHVKQVDATHALIAVQVENEVGMRDDSRDRCDAANQAFTSDVPRELMDKLAKRGDAVVPELKARWDANGHKLAGTWTEVFGDGLATDELFMAWHYATYVERVAAMAKAAYPLPLYANCWLDQPGTPKPGNYPSGGPLSHLLDVWQIGAPSIDILAPDLYVPEFAQRCAAFTRAGNPLFIPETNGAARAGANALFAFGRYDAICFSPFAIDGPTFPTPLDAVPSEISPLSQTYAALTNLAPLVLASQGTGEMTAVLLGKGALDENAIAQTVDLGGYKIEFAPGRPPRRPTTTPLTTTAPATPPDAWGAILIHTGDDEFTMLSTGISATFTRPDTPGKTTVASFDEGKLDDAGHWIRIRRLNGDETDHNREPSRAMQPYRIFRIKLFQRP